MHGNQTLHGQNIVNLDSLNQIIEEHKERDSVRVNMLIDIQPHYLANYHEKGKAFIEEAIEISKEINYAVGEGFSLNAFGAYYIRRGEYEKALKYTLESIEVFERINENQNIFAAYNNLAIVYKKMKNYKEGIDVYEKMLKALDGRPLTPSFVAIYFNVAAIYNEMEDFDKYEKWMGRVLSLSEKIDFPPGIVEGKLGLAETDLINGKYYDVIQKSQSVIEYIHKTGEMVQSEATAYKIIGLSYLELNQTNKANKSFFKSLKIYETINSVDKISEIHALIAKVYEKDGNFENALKHKTIHYQIKDSLFTQNKTQIIEELQTKYQTEKIQREKEFTELENLRLEKSNIKQKEKTRKNLYLFIGTLILLLFISILWFLYSKQQKLRKRNEFTEIKLEGATKRLEIEKQKRSAELKAIRSQLNPHFIFNLLNSVQEFVILGEKQKVNKALTNIADLMRKTLKNSEMELISLKDELSVIKLYLDAEKLRFEDRLNYQIILDDEVEDEFIKIPPMLIQPYVENAVKHGIMHSSENGLLKIEAVIIEDELLQITVEDNGVGREKAEFYKKQNTGNHNSFSTKANEERLNNIALETGIKANVNTIDLLSDNGDGIGTKVVVTLPLNT